MTSSIKKVVWLCGTLDLPEFAAAKKWLETRFEVRAYSGAELGSPLAIIDVREAYSPAAAALVKQLTADFPSAIVVQFLGPWCAGMGRTPGYLPNVKYVSWHAWETELPEFLDERLEREDSDVIGIVAADSTTAESLADAVRACGYKSVRLLEVSEPPTTNFDQLLLDIDGRREQAGWLKKWLAAADGKPVVVAASFGLMNAKYDWRKEGISAVVFKPFVLAQLKAVFANCSTIMQSRAEAPRAHAD